VRKPKVYVDEWVDRGCIRKMLVIDLRKVGSKQLPRPSCRNDKEFMKLAVDVCRDIDELRKSKSWSEIGDIYGVSRLTIRNWYVRYCGDRDE